MRRRSSRSAPAQLRADLFFLASDAMQGRLTDTRENAIAADWVLSRFERLGLQARRAGGSFDHRYFLMKASLGERNALVDRRTRRRSHRSQLTLGRAVLSAPLQRQRAPCRRALSFAGFGIVSPRARARRLSRRRSRSQIVAHPRPRAGRQRSGEQVRRRGDRGSGAAAPQGAGGAGEGRRRRHLRRGRAQPDRAVATSRRRPPTTGRRRRRAIERYTLKTWSDQVRIPVVQVSRGGGRTARGAEREIAARSRAQRPRRAAASRRCRSRRRSR